MKKVFALSMAAAMVMSMSAAAFAANSGLNDSENSVLPAVQVKENAMYSYQSGNASGSKMELMTEDPAFGKTVYFALLVNEGTEEEPNYQPAKDSKSVSGLKVTPKWTDGAQYIKSVEIVKKDGAYYVEVVTTGSELEDADVAGKIYLKGTVGTGDYKEKVDGYFDVDFSVSYGTITPNPSDKKLFVGDEKKVYDLSDVDQSEYTIYYSANGTSKNAVASVVTDVTNTEDILLGYNVDENATIAQVYSKANLDFVNLTGSFKKTAEVTIYADEGKYLYQIVDNRLQTVNAEYDEWEEGFVFHAKNLGSYVISDVSLNTAAIPSNGSNAGTTNPSTGAAL